MLAKYPIDILYQVIIYILDLYWMIFYEILRSCMYMYM